MTRFRRTMIWGVRVLPLITLAGLLIPGNTWVVQEARTFFGLITVLILPGYALARGMRLFERFDNWLDALTLSAALTWSVGLVLWLLFFFLNVPLVVVSFVWVGVTAAGLIASAFVPLPARLTARPSRPWLVVGIGIWIVGVIGVVYLYGGRVDGDPYSYMTWLRNVRAGDIRPGVNIHASWEQNYPFFKNLYAPTYLYYSMTSLLARVDTHSVWVQAPAVWAGVMLAVHFSLAKLLFKRRLIGYAMIVLLPLVYAGPALFSGVGDSHHICNMVLLPMAFWLFLRAVFDDHKQFWWIFPMAVLVAASLTFEHLPHIVHYLLVAGAFALFHILPRPDSVFWRSVVVILVLLLLITPFIWHTLQLASAYGFSAGDATTGNLDMSAVGRSERFLQVDGQRFFIVRPRRLLSAHTLPGLTVLGIAITLVHLKRLWRHGPARLPIASIAIVFFIGVNPILTPFLSRLIAPHATHRLSQALIIFPALAYGATRAGLRLRSCWRQHRRISVHSAVSAVIIAVLVGYNLSQQALKAINAKSRSIVYSPAGVSTNLSHRLIRRMIEDQLKSPPYPILNPPAQLTRYLDESTLHYIREAIPDNSVFLSERLTEYNLPAYANQLTYLGRLGWPEWGEICDRVRAEGAEIAFPRIGRPAVYHHLDVVCAVLDPEADPEDTRELLMANSEEIDYVLVTPNTTYLRGALDQTMLEAQIYDNGDFAIYSVGLQQ